MADEGTLLAQIIALEEALHRPDVRRARDRLESLLADEFREIGASGRFYGRAEIIELLTQEDKGGDESTFLASDYALTSISEDAVLLTYRTDRLQADGTHRHALRSSVWKREGCAWRLFFHQGTLTGPK
ncbi:DUF4440 domain-containing protein [Rhizobium oryzicola]|uniref:DUF4440 domain-containing protein n=1 Tax=Rhizobium oryzicola TaxID=1232668 RepID=A0ABT8T2A4_9HYPH|nr:DUF4440 domain-containing protein [Rhizobium oryzicola]MDO1584554.1 DUF4440 domain-containing protein [Rhizobium oryzicola]